MSKKKKKKCTFNFRGVFRQKMPFCHVRSHFFFFFFFFYFSCICIYIISVLCPHKKKKKKILPYLLPFQI